MAWPFAARAQQPALPAIGYLGSMAEAGFAESRNVIDRISGDWIITCPARAPGWAADLIRRQVSIIIGVSPIAAAVKALTGTIPGRA